MADQESIDKEVDQLLAKMQNNKVRMTTQRRAILKIILTKVDHPTVEEIYQQVLQVYPKMSLATVYNNVRAFVKAGILQELNFDEKTKHYDVFYQPHGHLICQQCGRVEDIFLNQWDNLLMTAKQSENFQVSTMEISFQGFCQKCLKKMKDKQPIN